MSDPNNGGLVVILLKQFKRVIIYAGNLGSGKTEVSINTAVALNALGRKTAIVDLDIINPYFRTRLVKEKLEKLDIAVISPENRFIFADQPAVSPGVKGVILNREISGVIDVGGDDIGALALAQYRNQIDLEAAELLFVINCCRPFTADSKGIIRYLESIENASGFKVSGLVNNTNLGEHTTADLVLSGYRTVMEVSDQLNLKIRFTSVRRDLTAAVADLLEEEAEILPIDKYMKAPWE
ncbi:MAG: hypothetical protein HGA27_07460 [Peptococcaceae bacterium]|nr:hypothetical protein [Peptococcaceae bacterium]